MYGTHATHTQHGLWVNAPTPTGHDMYGTHAKTQHGLWVDAPTPTAHFMYGTHATHTAWAVGRCTNTNSTWYVWHTCHTHSMGCGLMRQRPQHMVCMVHMPHTQHGLWVDAPTPTAHVMYGPHATHTAWAVG